MLLEKVTIYFSEEQKWSESDYLLVVVNHYCQIGGGMTLARTQGWPRRVPRSEYDDLSQPDPGPSRLEFVGETQPDPGPGII